VAHPIKILFLSMLLNIVVYHENMYFTYSLFVFLVNW